MISCRPTHSIRGLTQDTLIEVTANIDLQEQRRMRNETIGWEEHPRASSTDDVETFFSVSRRIIGQTFTLQDFKYKWRKLSRCVIYRKEFYKNTYKIYLNYAFT